MRKRLIVDFDDVLVKLIPAWVDKYNKESGDNLSPKSITDWDITKFVKPEWKEKIFTLLEPKDGKSLWDDIEPVEHSQILLEQLSKRFDVFIVSSVMGNYDICKYKVKCLEKHFPFLDKDKFYFVTDKSAVSGDYMIDDRYKNMEDFDGYRLLFNVEHNIGNNIVFEDQLCFRMNGWWDVYNFIIEDSSEE